MDVPAGSLLLLAGGYHWWDVRQIKTDFVFFSLTRLRMTGVFDDIGRWIVSSVFGAYYGALPSFILLIILVFIMIILTFFSCASLISLAADVVNLIFPEEIVLVTEVRT